MERELKYISVATPEDLNLKDDILGNDLDKILFNFSVYMTKIDFNNLNTPGDVLNKFAQIEKELNKYINSIKDLDSSQYKLLNLLTKEMLEYKFQENKKHSIFINNKIHICYDKIADSLKTKNYENIFNLIITDNKVDIESDKIIQIFKEILEYYYLLYINELKQVFKCNDIPNFLIRLTKKKIKQKLKLICNPFIRNYYQIYIENKLEVKILKNYFKQFNEGEILIFDSNILNKNLIKTLFDLFILSNVEYIQNDSLAFELFFNHLEKYIKIFNLHTILDTNYNTVFYK